MVVCKFFLQGNCRFGENCKFEHQINDPRQQHSSVLRQQNFNANPPPLTNTNIDTNTLVRAVINDSTTAEKGGQWLLSCYAPFKEKPNFPGFEEQSFEEIRWGFYEAQRLGTVDQYKQQLQMTLQSAVIKLRALQNPTPEAIVTITSIYNTTPNSSTINNANINNNPFGNNQSSVFGGNQSNSGFGQTNNFESAFNQQQNSSGKSIFATANQQYFANVPSQQQNSIFANAQTANTGIFGNANAFGQQQLPFVQPQQQQQQQPVIAGFGVVPQSGGFFSNTQQSAVPPFNTQQQTGASLFNTQPQNVPAFNTHPQSGVLPYGTPNQNEIAQFNLQQNANSQFAKPQQSVQQLFSTQQNATPAFNAQQNTSAIFNSSFGIQQQSNLPFSQAQQPPPNNPPPFATQANSQTSAMPFVGGGNVFANSMQSASLNSASSHSHSIFGSTQATVINTADYAKDEDNYSKIGDLSEEDIKSYENDRFEFGKIPEKPPTIEMCF